MGFFGHKTVEMVSETAALPGRAEAMTVDPSHLVLGHSIVAPFPQGAGLLLVGMGCFWGAERKLWQQPGVITTAVGYSGGFTPNPTYEEVCTGRTGHAEVVLVAFDPATTSYARLLTVFWESHDPTQGMRQGADVGTQYRSAVFTFDAPAHSEALASRDRYQAVLTHAGLGLITTEIRPAGAFYYAEGYHQQYLARNPNGYCGLGGTGLACPVGIAASGEG